MLQKNMKTPLEFERPPNVIGLCPPLKAARCQRKTVWGVWGRQGSPSASCLVVESMSEPMVIMPPC